MQITVAKPRVARQPVHTALLPIELTNSNDGQGRAWYRTKDRRNEMMETLVIDGHRRDPFPFPVVIHLTRILGKGQKRWDVDSGLRGGAKQLIDGLVSCGWMVDDSPKYVAEVRFFQHSDDRNLGPSTLVEVFRAFQ